MKSFYSHFRLTTLMSGKDFFVNRYRQLGWEFKNVELKQAIRINQSNSKDKKLEGRLHKAGIQVERIPFLEFGYWIDKRKVSVGATAEYLLGLYSIQEAAAQIPATLFNEIKNKMVLDACAAPGGKTTQLADLMENTGVITALDVRRNRLNAMVNHLERCHVSNTIVYNLDARQASKLNLKFDRILLDAPCSGNFATDEAWFKHRTMIDVERNARVQRELLKTAAGCLADDGELVYSTCSLEPEENELNINWAIANLKLQVEKIDCYGQKGLVEIFNRHLDSSVERCKRIWPDKTQGFFICKLKKLGDN